MMHVSMQQASEPGCCVLHCFVGPGWVWPAECEFPWGFHEVGRGAQGASRVAPGKLGFNGRGEGNACLYILEISCLSVASFAIIFSHSEGCLFTLLIVSFDVQKLLRLIRSHLFIFAFISNILEGGS